MFAVAALVAAMTASPALQARRALVKLILTLAALYRAVVIVNRDSCDSDVNKATKKLLLKVRPDKGGSENDTKKLNAAKEKWDKAKKSKGRPSGPQAGQRAATSQGELVEADAQPSSCRHGETHMWRKESETFSPELAGEDDYRNQVPLARPVPIRDGSEGRPSEGGQGSQAREWGWPVDSLV